MQTLYRYPYKVKTRQWVAYLVISLGLAALFGFSLFLETEPKSIFGLFSISPFLQNATLFIAAIVMGRFAIYSARVLFHSACADREVVLTREAITAPRSIVSKKMVTIPLAEVSGQKLITLSKRRRRYVLVYKGGRVILDEAAFASKKAFEEVVVRTQNSIGNRKILGHLDKPSSALIH